MSVLDAIAAAIGYGVLTFWAVVLAVLALGYAVHVVRGPGKGADSVLLAQGNAHRPHHTPAPNGEGHLSYATLEELTQ